jgi:predicted outer membrane repeat protein
MKNKNSNHILIILGILLLFAFSLQSLSAANITNSTSGGIAKGLLDTPDNGILLLDAGNYTGVTNKDLNITRNVTIKGNGSTDSVTIDAEGTKRIFSITANNLHVTFINITFANGINHNNNGGGAIRNAYAGTSISVINCTFTNNRASTLGNSGGAIFNEGINLNVTGSTFINNYATAGAAIWNAGNNCYVFNSSFTKNYALSTGGGIYNNATNLYVSNSTFTDNLAPMTGGGGAGIYNNRGANCTVTNSTFNNNNGANGAAIGNNYATSSISVINCKFTDNTATNHGGAIWNTAGNFSLINSTFTDNSATNQGGAIYNNGYMNVSFNTMVGNTASLGTMIYNAGSMTGLKLIFINNSTFTVVGMAVFTIFANLTDDMGNTVTGQNIIFTVNGATIGVNTSVEGYAFVDCPINFKGTVPVSGEYSGLGNNPIKTLNGQLKNTLNTSTTIVIPGNVKIPVESSEGNPININGVLTDENDDLLKNVYFEVTVDGKTTIVLTDDLGRWSVTYTPIKEGIVTVVAKFAGEYYYDSFENSAVFTVSKDKVTSSNKDTNNTDIINNVDNNDIDNADIADDNNDIDDSNDNNNLVDGNNIESTNGSVASAAVKSTGIPIITILLVLLSTLGLCFTRKRD